MILKVCLLIFLIATVIRQIKKLQAAQKQGTARSTTSHKLPTSPRRSGSQDIEMTDQKAKLSATEDELMANEEDDDDGDVPLLQRMRHQDVNTAMQDSNNGAEGDVGEDVEAPKSKEEQAVEKQQAKNDLQAILKKDSKIPYDKLLTLSMIWVMLFFLNCMRGSKKMPSFIGVTNCSFMWAALNVAIYVFLIGVTVLLGQDLLKDYKERVNLNFPFQEGDMRWSEEGVKRYPTLTFAAGLLAGLVGIGGGMVLGPLLLELGMIPQVSSVTAALMVFFTASAAVVQYIMLGVYPFGYTVLYATVGFTGGWVSALLENDPPRTRFSDVLISSAF